MTRYFKYIIPVLLLFSLSCSGDRGYDGKPVIMVSIEPQRKILEQIAGDDFKIITLLTGGADPETFEPSVAQRIEADRCAAFFTIGYLPFEKALADNISSDVKIVDTSRGIDPIKGTHSGHDDIDPHTWTSLRNAASIAANMKSALLELNPSDSAKYEKRYGLFLAYTDSIDRMIARRLSSNAEKAFAVWHPSLSYFARDYGLCQISVGQESKETSLQHMRHIIEKAKADGVKVFFFQKEYDSRQAESINAEIGSRLVTINPLGYDWDIEIIRIADELTR